MEFKKGRQFPMIDGKVVVKRSWTFCITVDELEDKLGKMDKTKGEMVRKEIEGTDMVDVLCGLMELTAYGRGRK